jgi:hypothetical protein
MRSETDVFVSTGGIFRSRQRKFWIDWQPPVAPKCALAKLNRAALRRHSRRTASRSAIAERSLSFTLRPKILLQISEVNTHLTACPKMGIENINQNFNLLKCS